MTREPESTGAVFRREFAPGNLADRAAGLRL